MFCIFGLLVFFRHIFLVNLKWSCEKWRMFLKEICWFFICAFFSLSHNHSGSSVFSNPIASWILFLNFYRKFLVFCSFFFFGSIHLFFICFFLLLVFFLLFVLYLNYGWVVFANKVSSYSGTNYNRKWIDEKSKENKKGYICLAIKLNVLRLPDDST